MRQQSLELAGQQMQQMMKKMKGGGLMKMMKRFGGMKGLMG